MTRYYLLKDLPGAKAGTEIYPYDDNGEYRIRLVKDQEQSCIAYVTKSEYSDWIEERNDTPKTHEEKVAAHYARFTGLDALIPTMNDNDLIHGTLGLTRAKVRAFIEKNFTEKNDTPKPMKPFTTEQLDYDA